METTGQTVTKVCIKCGEEKNEDCFRISNKKTGNRRTDCRDCEREISKARSFKMTRGITHEERDKLLETQDGCCASCGTDDPGSSKGWHVDHCHKNGDIRGVLCSHCNVALGQVNDSVEHLELLIQYLKDRGYGKQL